MAINVRCLDSALVPLPPHEAREFEIGTGYLLVVNTPEGISKEGVADLAEMLTSLRESIQQSMPGRAVNWLVLPEGVKFEVYEVDQNTSPTPA